MSELQIEIVCAVQLGSDWEENARVILAMKDKGYEVRKGSATEFIFGKSESFSAFLGRVIESRRNSETSKPAAPAKRAPAIAQEKRHCALCPKKIRIDNKPCPKCGRGICTGCRSFYHDNHCNDCVKTLPDGRSENGRKPTGKAKPVKKGKPDPARAVIDFRPNPGQQCESCDKNKAAVKCAGCAKMICGKCAQWQNGQCRECAAAPAL